MDSVKSLPAGSAERLLEITPSGTVKHTLPKLEKKPRIQSIIEKDCGKIHRESSCIYALSGARILGSAYSHGVIAKGDFWIQNQCESYGLSPESHPIRFTPFLPRCKKICGTMLCLTTRHSSNYYHWIFDVVARILKMESSGALEKIDGFLVLDLHEPAFKIESLEYFGIDQSKMVNVHARDHWKCMRMILFDRPLDAPVQADTIRMLQKRAKPAELSRGGRLVYLSRGNARTRRIKNEDELVAGLTKLGFISVKAEELAFQEQVSIFQGAEAVVSAHGAGLTNLIFCRKGTRVFEIFPTGYIRPDYAFISEKCGLKYHFILCGSEADVDPSNYSNNSPDEMIVDVPQVLETVRSSIESGK